jgi:hypothetical protein
VSVGGFVFDIRGAGSTKLVERFVEMRSAYPKAFAAAMYMVAANVMQTAMKLTPVLTGYLRNSRYLTRPTSMFGTVVNFEGAFSAPHAAYVHNIDAAYRVGEWKFLLKAVRYHETTFARDVAALVTRLARSGLSIESVPLLLPDAPMQGPYRRPRGTMRARIAALGRDARTAFSPKNRRSAANRIRAQHRREKAEYLRDVLRNQGRIMREKTATRAAQREGRALPRPGR